MIKLSPFITTGIGGLMLYWLYKRHQTAFRKYTSSVYTRFFTTGMAILILYWLYKRYQLFHKLVTSAHAHQDVSNNIAGRHINVANSSHTHHHYPETQRQTIFLKGLQEGRAVSWDELNPFSRTHKLINLKPTVRCPYEFEIKTA